MFDLSSRFDLGHLPRLKESTVPLTRVVVSHPSLSVGYGSEGSVIRVVEEEKGTEYGP